MRPGLVKKSTFILTLCTLTLCAWMQVGFAQEAPTMKVLLDEKEASALKSPIKFSGLTLGWVNARLIEQRQKPLFCTPPNFLNWSDDFFPLLQNWVSKNKWIQDERVTSYPRHLIDALVDRFPCK